MTIERRRTGRQELIDEAQEFFAKLFRVLLERELATPVARHGVDDEGIFRSCYLLKEDGWFSFFQSTRRNLGNFKIRVDFNLHPVKFTGLLKIPCELTVRVKVHGRTINL
jgi:hypothetical protein